MNLCRRFVTPDPARRFPSAEAAELLEDGAAQFHRQLVFGDLASEYEHDIRVWLEELRQLDDEVSKDGRDNSTGWDSVT